MSHEARRACINGHLLHFPINFQRSLFLHHRCLLLKISHDLLYIMWRMMDTNVAGLDLLAYRTKVIYEEQLKELKRTPGLWCVQHDNSLQGLTWLYC